MTCATTNTGYWIIAGWTSKANLLQNGNKIVSLPIQTDQDDGRQWLRPGNQADVLAPVQLIDTPTGQRFPYGGIRFQWNMQGLSPNMVSFLQDTFFSPSGSPQDFMQKSYSNKVTVQTFNRATGNYEIYQCYGKFTNFNGEADAIAGGYNNMLLTFIAYNTAPEGPDASPLIEFSASNVESEPVAYTKFDYSLDYSVVNEGDGNTFSSIIKTIQVPSGAILRSAVIGTGWSAEYSTDDELTYVQTEPVLSDVTHVRLTYNPILELNKTTPINTFTFRTDTIQNITFNASVSTNGDANEENNTGSITVTVNNFTPDVLGPENLYVWLDAGAETFNLISPETSASGGDSIERWKTVNNPGTRFFTQNTASEQPTLLTGDLNGEEAVQFDGNDDNMEGTSPIQNGDNFSIFIGFNAINNNTKGVREVLLRLSGMLVYHIGGENNGSIGNVAIGSNSEGSPYEIFNEFDAAQSGAQLYEFHVDADVTFSNDFIEFRRNGTVIASDVLFQNNVQPASAADQYAVGADSRITFGTPTPVDFFEGKIYEIVVYIQALTTAEKLRIREYFNDKYGFY